jgi:hypothetical protein
MNWSHGVLICEIVRPITPTLLKEIITPIPSWKTKLNRGDHVPQTDFDQRAVILIHRGLISGYIAPRGSVCREKRLTKCALLKNIAADFARIRLRVSEYPAGRAGSILNS